MPPVKSSPIFREWLSSAIDASGLSKREIARRMAAKHPRGITLETIETGRRTINKILAGDLTPTQPTRDSIAEALERDDAPSVASEDDDEESDVAELLKALAIQQAQIDKQMRRVMRAVAVKS